MQISNPDKVLFPDDGLTKTDLAGYYERMAETMLPWLRDRPVAMVRYPDGLRGGSIMQKNVPRYFPDWIRTAEVPKQGGTVRQVVGRAVLAPGETRRPGGDTAGLDRARRSGAAPRPVHHRDGARARQ